jgi:hypothetical protein
MRTTITTGTQFQHRSARPWTNADGRKVWHSTVTLCEISGMTGRSVDYVVVELLEESGRPDDGAMVPTPGSTGSYLPIAFREAAQRGSVTLLRKGHQVGRG